MSRFCSVGHICTIWFHACINGQLKIKSACAINSNGSHRMYLNWDPDNQNFFSSLKMTLMQHRLCCVQYVVNRTTFNWTLCWLWIAVCVLLTTTVYTALDMNAICDQICVIAFPIACTWQPITLIVIKLPSWNSVTVYPNIVLLTGEIRKW